MVETLADKRARWKREEEQKRNKKSSSSSQKLIKDTLKIGGKVIVGYRLPDGRFSPTSESASKFSEVVRKTGTQNIEQLKAIERNEQVQKEKILKDNLEKKKLELEKAKTLKEKEIKKQELDFMRKNLAYYSQYKTELPLKQRVVKEEPIIKGETFLKVGPENEKTTFYNLPEKTQREIRKYITPTKEDGTIKRILKGGATLVYDSLVGLGQIQTDLRDAALGNSIAKTNLKTTFKEGTDILSIGEGLGLAIQSSDPFISSQGLFSILSVNSPKSFKGGIRTGGAIIKYVKKNKLDKLPEINSNIKILENNGVNVRQRDVLGKKLRLLKEEKKIIESDLKEIDKTIKIFSQPMETTSQKKKVAKQLNPIIKKTYSNAKKINNIKKKSQKLKPETISKGLGLIFKQEKPKVKLKKILPKNELDLIQQLIIARKTSGDAFSKLKKKIKKERGLNVVERKEKGVISYKLLEPKEQRRKGKKVERKEKKKIIEVIIPEIEKRSLKDIDRNTKLFYNSLKKSKKAQTQIPQIQFKKYYIKVGKGIKKNKQDIQKFVNKYFPTQNKQKPFNSKTKSTINWSKDELNKLKTEQKKISLTLQELKKSNYSLKLLKKGLLNLGLISSAQAKGLSSLIKQSNIIIQESNFINNFKFPKPNYTPTPKIKGGGNKKVSGGGNKKGDNKKYLPLKLKSGEKLKRDTSTPYKPKPRLIPKPDSNWESKIKGKLGVISYKIGNKVKTIKTNLPYNKAVKLAKETIDNTPLASMTVKAYGNTKQKDIKSPTLNKFRVKRSKSKLVQQMVEKRKYRIDTTGEKKELKVSKFIKNKIKRLL